MYIFLTDETNKFPGPRRKFFIYGGVAFPAERLKAIDAAIKAIRENAGYKPGDAFKFDTRSRPRHVTQEIFTKAKKEVLEVCLRNEVSFIVYVILHEIIANQDQRRQLTWAADHVIGRFNKFLDEKEDFGICVVDNLPSDIQYKYLTDKFQHGLKLDDGSEVRLDRIKLFAASCVGASHANSLIDIVLGSFRYCVNYPRNVLAAREMMGAVTVLMWHKMKAGIPDINERGLIMRPREIKVDKYRKEYEKFLDNIISLFSE